jgi:hypothetical protein
MSYTSKDLSSMLQNELPKLAPPASLSEAARNLRNDSASAGDTFCKQMDIGILSVQHQTKLPTKLVYPNQTPSASLYAPPTHMTSFLCLANVASTTFIDDLCQLLHLQGWAFLLHPSSAASWPAYPCHLLLHRLHLHRRT